MNEVVIISFFIIALVVPPALALTNLKPLWKLWIHLVTGLLLIILVWVVAEKAAAVIKWLATALIIASAIKTVKEYMEERGKRDQESHTSFLQ
jgi:hypothetical protein